MATMRVVYLMDHDGHKAGQDCFIERSLGRRVCQQNIAIPYPDYVKKLEADAEAKAKREAAAEKAKREEELKKKVAPKKETATSKKVTKRKKAVK